MNRHRGLAYIAVAGTLGLGLSLLQYTRKPAPESADLSEWLKNPVAEKGVDLFARCYFPVGLTDLVWWPENDRPPVRGPTR